MRPNSILVAGGGFLVDAVLQILYSREIASGKIELDWSSTMSSAFGVIQDSVLYDPLRPAAMVANTDDDTEEEIEEGRAACRRMLHRATFQANWLVAFAIPDAEAWIMADPVVREAVDRMDPAPTTRRERIARISEMGKHRPIDREAIARAFPDFRALDEFIKSRVKTSEPVA